MKIYPWSIYLKYYDVLDIYIFFYGQLNKFDLKLNKL